MKNADDVAIEAIRVALQEDSPEQKAEPQKLDIFQQLQLMGLKIQLAVFGGGLVALILYYEVYQRYFVAQ